MVGRKLGDVAKESDRFDTAVAKRAWKSGNVEVLMCSFASCAKVLGHIDSAPSST
jgi:hypothetical protein